MIPATREHNAYYGNERDLDSYSVCKIMQGADINGNHSSSSTRATLEDGDNVVSVNDTMVSRFGEDDMGRTLIEILDRESLSSDVLRIGVHRACEQI